jgi:hypothetical protein
MSNASEFSSSNFLAQARAYMSNLQFSPDQYKIYVGPDVDNLQLYLFSSQSNNNVNINNGFCYLYGSYYGSSTRINPIGTVFNSSRLEYPPVYSNSQGKHIRIMRGDEILHDVFVTAEQFMNHSYDVNFSVCLDNNITVYLRDLHRFEDYPYEISGVRFPI